MPLQSGEHYWAHVSRCVMCNNQEHIFTRFNPYDHCEPKLPSGVASRESEAFPVWSDKTGAWQWSTDADRLYCDREDGDTPF